MKSSANPHIFNVMIFSHFSQGMSANYMMLPLKDTSLSIYMFSFKIRDNKDLSVYNRTMKTGLKFLIALIHCRVRCYFLQCQRKSSTANHYASFDFISCYGNTNSQLTLWRFVSFTTAATTTTAITAMLQNTAQRKTSSTPLKKRR